MTSAQEIRSHNETVLSQLEPGDIIRFPRAGYSHYGVYGGDKNVIHRGENDEVGSCNSIHICGQGFNKAMIREDNFFKVAGQSKAEKCNKDDQARPLGYPMEIVIRARSRLGEIGYDLIWKNCEHFATWCRYGKGWSDQVYERLGPIGTSAVAVVTGVWAMLGLRGNRS